MSIEEITGDSFADFLFQSFASTTASYNGHSILLRDAPPFRDEVRNRIQKLFDETAIDHSLKPPESPRPRRFQPFIDPEAAIPPHTSWNAKERSRSFETSGQKLSRGRIGGINGIGNRFEEAESHANRLSAYADNRSVEWVYNCSHSLLIDVCEAFLLNYRSISIPAKFLKENWIRFHEAHRDDPDAKYLQFCHSQGAIHVKNALSESSREIQNRVVVVAISPAAIIPKSLCFDSFNYASNRDVVSLGEIAADAIFNPLKVLQDFNDLKELILIDPDPRAATFDHNFNSPTFEFVINRHVNDYIEQYGSEQ